VLRSAALGRCARILPAAAFLRKGAGAAACLVVLLPAVTWANGWEHGAVPLPALLSALAAEDPGLRARAAESLGYRGQPEAVEPLMEAFAAEPQSEPRAAMATALGRIAEAAAVPLLSDCVEDERDDRVRASCAAALGGIGDADALPALFAAIEDDPSILVVSEAVDALGGFGDPETVTRLAEIAAGGDRSLAARAIASLGRTGAPEAAAPLLTLLEDAPSDEQRARIVEALGRLAVPKAAGPLTALLESTQDPVLKIRIAVALAAIRDGGTRPALAALLKDPVPAVQWYALEGLAALKDPGAAGDLVAFARSLAEQRRALAPEQALAEPERALAALSLETRALSVLTELDAPAARDLFLAAAEQAEAPSGGAAGLALANGMYQLRRAALYGLAYTRAAERAGAFLAGPAGIGDPDPRLRAVALRSLAALGAPAAKDAALKSLEDESPEMRWTAAMVLGRMSGAGAEPALIAALGDLHGEVRRQAAASLGYLGAVAARPALEELAANDPRAAVRAEAVAALRMLTGG
jgi:HEAT repeat protein